MCFVQCKFRAQMKPMGKTVHFSGFDLYLSKALLMPQVCLQVVLQL